MLLNVLTQERGEGITATHFIDSEWGRLEDCIPRSISARTPEQREVMDEYIRAAQWLRMMSTGNRWERWCVAARDWVLEQQNAQSGLPQDADLEALLNSDEAPGSGMEDPLTPPTRPTTAAPSRSLATPSQHRSNPLQRPKD